MLQIMRRRLTLPLAAVLLGLQALGGGAVALAHAAERTSAPAAFEARDTASCAVLHDAARCALCQYAGLRVQPTAAASPPPAGITAVLRCISAASPTIRSAGHLTAPARAPPVAS